jgi:phosphonate transport system substrate-binding protein
MRPSRRHLLASAILAAPGLAFAQSRNPDPSRLRVALLPDESPSTVIQNNRPLELYLERLVGKPIELIVTTDYSSMIEAMRFGRIEMGYFGPFSYVLAKTRAPEIEAFATPIQAGSPTYRSVIVARADGPVKAVADIRGRLMAYGDPASTSSALVPRALLLEAGLTAGTDYRFVHLGAHDAVARAVQARQAEAGALSEQILLSLYERRLVDREQLVVIGRSEPIPNYPWTMQGWLAQALKDRIRRAFLELTEEAVLRPFRASGFAPITDADYDVLRAVARSLNLDLGSFRG